jgi:hypothetical protein
MCAGAAAVSFWRRAVAIFVVVLFVPASTLAGASMHHCVSDGHAAVEFVVRGLHHVQTHEGHDHSKHQDGLGFVEATELVGCVDAPLLSDSLDAKYNGSAPAQPEDIASATAVDAHPIVRKVSKPCPVAMCRFSPQLVALRTVVLLI